MKLEITATAVKSWFQYHCERKFVYDSMPLDERRTIPIEEALVTSPWAEFGNEFEQRVVAELSRTSPGQLLGPIPGSDQLSEAMSLAFLGRRLPEQYAHQTVLRETPTLRRLLQLPPEISIRPGKPDLLQVGTVDGRTVFRIIDVKATQVATVFHKAQVALYALMLRCALKEQNLAGEIAALGAIWHLSAPGEASTWQEETFPLRGYESFVVDFFRSQAQRLISRRVDRQRDDTFFHIYFKCEQCKYLKHCEKVISDQKPSRSWDVSAVPGLSHESKRALMELGVRSVGELGEAAGLAARGHSLPWALKARGELVVARARALSKGVPQRVSERHSWLMPPRVDVAIHLVADRDPVDGNLVTLGCLVARDGREEFKVAVIRHAEEERQALRDILGHVVEVLSEVDRWNASHDEAQGLFAHVFLYEPSEAFDLQEALGRHLTDPGIRAGLLHLIRMFPPEEVIAAEPEYRGIHHLPATALKSVVDQLYALPVKVAYDLAGVTGALVAANPPVLRPYVPASEFKRPFSSRLSIEVSRALRAGAGDAAAVRRDVEARLAAMDGLMRWILADNAQTTPSFLRLNKKPFRFQSQFHPLDATDLDVLVAHELLENRAALMATLTELARPSEERRDRFRCFAHLRLVRTRSVGRAWRMHFVVPPESRQAEIYSGTIGLILTNDDPDLRLNPQMWGQVKVSISADLESNHQLEVEVFRSVYESATFERLRRTTAEDGWFLDTIHVDFNTERVVRFLRSLAEVKS